MAGVPVGNKNVFLITVSIDSTSTEMNVSEHEFIKIKCVSEEIVKNNKGFAHNFPHSQGEITST
jgi:hypothetical protein